MFKSITLAIKANTTGMQEDTFELTFPDIYKSPFCPKSGRFKGWLTIPQEDCFVTDLELRSGFSVDFTVGKLTPEGDNLRTEMFRPLMSRNGNSLPQLRPNAIIEILVGNGWKCPRFATV